MFQAVNWVSLSHERSLFLSVPQTVIISLPCLVPEPAGLWGQPARGSVFPLRFWFTKVLVCCLSRATPLSFPRLMFGLTLLCVYVGQRDVAKIEQPCQVDCKSWAQVSTAGRLRALRAVTLREGITRAVFP